MTCFLAAQSIINLITPKHPCRAPHTGTTPVDIHEHSACLRSTGLSVCAINCFTTFVLRCVMCVAFFFSVLFWFGFCLIRTAVSPWQCIDKNSLIHQQQALTAQSSCCLVICILTFLRMLKLTNCSFRPNIYKIYKKNLQFKTNNWMVDKTCVGTYKSD